VQPATTGQQAVRLSPSALSPPIAAGATYIDAGDHSSGRPPKSRNRPESAGLEPATSWVRSRRSGVPHLADLQGLYSSQGAAVRRWIAADIGRFSSFQALMAMSA
jgi:hypothetical protein